MKTRGGWGMGQRERLGVCYRSQCNDRGNRGHLDSQTYFLPVPKGLPILLANPPKARINALGRLKIVLSWPVVQPVLSSPTGSELLLRGLALGRYSDLVAKKGETLSGGSGEVDSRVGNLRMFMRSFSLWERKPTHVYAPCLGKNRGKTENLRINMRRF